jgi:hypothetical protein
MPRRRIVVGAPDDGAVMMALAEVAPLRLVADQ